MFTHNIKFIFLAAVLLSLLNVGCGDVNFTPIEVSGKAEFPGDPDDPVNPRPEEPVDPRPEEPVDPRPEEPEDPVNPNPEPVTEEQTFLQNSGGGKVDLLIVVDNSDSMMMDHSRHNIRDMFRGFLSSLDGVDYQIGFIVTDMETTTFPASNPKYPGWNGRLDVLEGTNQKILTPNTANKQSLFLNTIDREEAIECRQGYRDSDPGAPCGTNTEEPLKSIMAFVDKRNTDNAGFFRSDADFVTVIISDEDERSKGEDQAATRPEQVINHIQSAFGGTKSYTNYSVVIEPGDRQCKQKQACSEIFCLGGGNYGDFATALSNMTSGKTTSICGSDVTPDFNVIGNRARNGGLFDEVSLQYDPIAGSVQVFFNPATDIGYSVDGRTVKFDRKPPAGTEIKVVYEHL